MVDGAENNPPTYVSQNHYTVAKYYTLTGHLIIPEIFVFSKVKWDKLSKDDQALIRKFSREAQMEQRALWDARVASDTAKLKTAGVEFIVVDKKPFYDLTAPVRTKYGKDYTALISRSKNQYRRLAAGGPSARLRSWTMRGGSPCPDLCACDGCVYLASIWIAGLALIVMTVVIPIASSTATSWAPARNGRNTVGDPVHGRVHVPRRAASYRAGVHIAVTMLTDRVPEKYRTALTFLVDALMAVLSSSSSYTAGSSAKSPGTRPSRSSNAERRRDLSAAARRRRGDAVFVIEHSFTARRCIARWCARGSILRGIKVGGKA